VSTTTATVPRPTGSALIGGVLWLLLPAAAWWSSGDEPGHSSGLARVAVVASFWIFGVLAPALLVAAVTTLRPALVGTGRLGRTGVVVAAVGYGAMAIGNGIETASITLGGGEVDFGHATFLVGFLVSVVGGILTGFVVFRRRRDSRSRAGALLLALALPLGFGIALLGMALLPANDAGFWAAISVPTGLAWVLLGRSISSSPAPEPAPARIG
jgi:hypothetical protein